MSKFSNLKHEGWNRNTELGCDLKTILNSDVRMKTGREYRGVLCLDSDAIVDDYYCRDAHYTFIETLSPTACKRNPRLFDGEYITVTRRDDGSLRPNFKPIKMDRSFSVDAYAIKVCNELRQALKGLVEE
jgi:hypothetical protein